MFAAALEVLGSVYWNVCKVGADTSRLLAFNFTVLRFQEVVIFEVMITEAFRRRTNYLALESVRIDPARIDSIGR